MAEEAPQGYLRDREDEDSARVSFAELFFDLVFVLAVTQLAAFLAGHLTLEGFAQAWVLFMAMWWFWINTTWSTNRLDLDRSVVRVAVFALMALGLLFSGSILRAFDDRGLVFAIAYVAMQVGRSLFMVWVLATHDDPQRPTAERMAIWFVASGLLWIGGGLIEGDLRVLLWTLALAVELGGPWLGFHVPGHGKSSASDLEFEGEHLAERCGLFIILSLGESLLVTGALMGSLDWSPVTLAAFGLALIGSVTMWWIYFDTGVHRGTRAVERSKDPGRLARFAYTYVHLPIVAGIVGSAVADKLLLAHPLERVSGLEATVVLGGPALFLLGNYLFKNATDRRWPLSHVIGLGLLALAAPFAGQMPTLGLAAHATLALVAVAVLERVLLRSRAAARSGVD